MASGAVVGGAARLIAVFLTPAARGRGRLGFVDTGQRRPYPLGADRDEIVMARPAAPS